jgi:hypothetical protein
MSMLTSSHRTSWAVLTLAFACFWVGAAVAQPSDNIVITEGKSPQGYPFMHGGIGSAEREQMEGKGKVYNLKLSFADRRGPYLAGVQLVIEGEKRAEIVNLTTSGPLFYIQLPPGSYTVKATFGAKTHEIKALKIVKDRQARHTFVWDAGGEPDPVAAR